MSAFSVVEFVIPSDAKHVGPEFIHAACACPECLEFRSLMLVWTLGFTPVIVAQSEYGAWIEKLLRKENEAGVPTVILNTLLELHFIGEVTEANWPSASYMAHRRKAIGRWLKHSSTVAP